MRSDAVMMTRRYSRTGMLRAAIALVATLLVVSAVIPPGPSADAATRCTGSEWVGAWTAAPSNAGLASEPAPSRALVDQTVRMVVRPTLAGSRARVRLTHRYGAIALPGARDVIILLGVNDLGGDEQRTARQLIDGLATMTRRAKRTGLRVHLGTLTPSGGCLRCLPGVRHGTHEPPQACGQPVDPAPDPLGVRRRLRQGRAGSTRSRTAAAVLRLRRPPTPERRRLPGHGRRDPNPQPGQQRVLTNAAR